MKGKKSRKGFGDLVIAVDKNYMPMMEVSRRHAIKAVVTDRAEILWLEDWSRTGLPEDHSSIREFMVIHYPWANAISDSRIIVGRGYRGILERDQFECQYNDCKRKATTIDHVMPRSRGGLSTPSNLVACCLTCNQKKADKTPEEAGMKLKHPIRSFRYTLINKFNKLVEEHSNR